jgi:predicted nucleic acid-binding protein
VRTSLDTNILSALWSRQPLGPQVAGRLVELHSEGGLVVCAPVYVELCAGPSLDQGLVRSLLAEINVAIDFVLDQNVWQLAAQGFAAYAHRRRESGGGTPKRLPVDFLVGSHALLRADRLMTLDTNPYRLDFPALRLVTL